MRHGSAAKRSAQQKKNVVENRANKKRRDCCRMTSEINFARIRIPVARRTPHTNQHRKRVAHIATRNAEHYIRCSINRQQPYASSCAHGPNRRRKMHEHKESLLAWNGFGSRVSDTLDIEHRGCSDARSDGETDSAEILDARRGERKSVHLAQHFWAG